MSWTNREKYMLGAIIAVLVIGALIGVYLLGRSIGENATTATAPTAARTTPTQTAPARPQTVVTVTVPAAETAETAAPPAVPLEITERTARPEVVSVGMPMEYTVKVRGEAATVTMAIRGAVEYSLALHKVSTVGDTTTWAVNAPAPGTPGIYRYFASAVGLDGTMVEMPGTSAWTFQVNP